MLLHINYTTAFILCDYMYFPSLSIFHYLLVAFDNLKINENVMLCYDTYMKR